ncbi:facilitated trehalose transporter Tret1-like [Amphibalanus amphitrite]|uniref:facilitated trehalose transporter Tret1-like n=1 Tax=Amphibalanus amphitrite TaxID=1232801 RepID=UPI001C91009A|nr:facilitated trehalose transporter Tret1-like [Amphibalanus amphitrite]
MNTPEVKMSEPCYLVSHRPEGVLQTHVAITPTLETPELAHTVKEPVTLHDSGDHHDGLTGCQLLRQVVIGVIVAMVTVSVAANNAASVMLPQLMSNGSDITLTATQVTWFASVNSLAAAAGSTMGGMAVHHLGPRRVLLLQALPTIAGWLMQALANGFPVLFIGRCLVGACTGLSMSAGQVYRAEMSSPQIRGRLVCLAGLFDNVGAILSYVIGYLLPWRWVPAAFVIVFLVPSALGMLLVPESPYWLMGKQRPEDARRSLLTLRGDPAVADKDLAIITEACKSRQKALTPRELAKEMSKLCVLAPFLTVLALFALGALAGLSMLTYLVVIFKETGSSLDAHQASILFGCVRTCNMFLVLYMSDHFGRRPLLIFSSVGCTLTTLSMAAFLFGRDQVPEWAGWRQLSWLPLALMLFYIIAFDFGFGRTTWVVHAELLPNRVRSALSGFGVLMHFGSASVSIFAFPFIRDAFTLAGAFCFFALFSFLGLLLTVFLIPETKNQRLEAIEAFYVHRFHPERK